MPTCNAHAGQLGSKSMGRLEPATVAAMMDKLRYCFHDGTVSVADGLPSLLDALRRIPTFGQVSPRPTSRPSPPANALTAMMIDLRDPLRALEQSGLLADPWAATALGRDEVRNASVLRWFLDPRGGHGCGDALLIELLARIGYARGGFPTRPSPYCSVSVEECPDGDRASRVDIQVEDPCFFLIVEVKIDAPEQPRQIERYCDIASTRACGRPWAVAFLTTDGRRSTTDGRWSGRSVPMAWADVAGALRRTARTAAPIPRFLATSFASHISNL